ncbi:metallophosphoesterase [Oceanicola sp. 22II-s10i]|uniref:metallophosphoesterase family protein n=1 Tax=Oceanicola sp. 22II-s10i TaxID=1317116 RepID=UPI000B524C97|nr:metallophosphoesterase [Oceanicola sp. 22II-s10i]
MTRLLHLSDLHFGRDRPELLEPLLDAVNRLSPDLVAISGDLTQRARDHQFTEAREFIDRIEAPVLTVPGNHDIPIHRPFTRLFDPFGPYRRGIGRDAAGPVELPGMLVIGLNTVDPRRWQRGRIRQREIRRACAAATAADPDDLVVLVAHHPFEQRANTDKRLMRGAFEAVGRLADCGCDVVLSGHLHLWLTEPFLTRPGGQSMLQVHAGTGLSTRARGEPNDFACIERQGDVLRIERWIAGDDVTAGFTCATVRHFRRGVEGWRSADGQGPVPRGPLSPDPPHGLLAARRA